MVLEDSEEAKSLDMSSEENKNKTLDEFTDGMARSQDMFLRTAETVPFFKDRVLSMVEQAAEQGLIWMKGTWKLHGKKYFLLCNKKSRCDFDDELKVGDVRYKHLT